MRAEFVERLRWPTWLGGERRRAPVRARPKVNSAIDLPLLWVTLALLLGGLVMVYSATIALPDSQRFAAYSSTHFLVRHALALMMASIAALVAFAVPTRELQRWASWLFLLGLVLLVIVLIPGIGKVVFGARRWLPLGILNLQPSEVMKLAVVIYIADYTVRKQDHMHSFRKGFAPMGVAVALIGMLLLLEPDMGAFVVICAISMGLLFLGGVNGWIFTGLVATAITTFSVLILTSPYRRGRMFAYLDPFEPANAIGKGYQLSHSLIAFGRGEIFGVGLGGSVEKLHYLPEAHTDFLLAVIGEEFGLVGVLVVIALMFWLVRRCIGIGRQAVALDRIFPGLVAQGVGLWIGAQAFINMGVNTGLLPTKGLTLPLMSFGGSGLLMNCIAIAIVMRVDFENRKLMRGGSA